MPNVNPDILIWARETTGLSIDEAAKKLTINAAYGKTGAERLQELESGLESPSRSILVKMANQYRRPLLTFYLNSIPLKGRRGTDFRSLPDHGYNRNNSLLDALIRDVIARQGLIKAAIIDDEHEKVSFIETTNITDDISDTANKISEYIDLTLVEMRSTKDPNDLFNLIREKIELTGVFVMLLGNLGSHHTNIDLNEFRGFVISDEVAPFIIINDQDSKSAWTFTLVHEFVHLLLGETGVSGNSQNHRVEKFCNDVASEFLLPAEELEELSSASILHFENIIDLIDEFATKRNLSKSMVAYKLYRLRYINRSKWENISSHFKSLWVQSQEQARTRNRNTDGGPSYYVVRRHRLGDAIIKTTARFMAEGIITTTKAGTILGVKPTNVQALIKTLR